MAIAFASDLVVKTQSKNTRVVIFLHNKKTATSTQCRGCRFWFPYIVVISTIYQAS